MERPQLFDRKHFVTHLKGISSREMIDIEILHMGHTSGRLKQNIPDPQCLKHNISSSIPTKMNFRLRHWWTFIHLEWNLLEGYLYPMMKKFVKIDSLPVFHNSKYENPFQRIDTLSTLVYSNYSWLCYINVDV